MKWLLALVVVLLSSAIAFSQSSIQFNHYTVEHRLSDNIVNDIAQDNNGVTWLEGRATSISPVVYSRVKD